MQSIFGAVLAAGYASAVGAAVAAAPNQDQITDGVQSQLQKSFGSAADVAQQHPQYASEITAAARSSFIDGADWAYLAGIIAILVGAAVVFFLFPRKQEEQELLARYQAEDAAAAPTPVVAAQSAGPAGDAAAGTGR
jgi:hypothetical protein